MGLLDWLSDAIGSSNGSGGNMLSEGMPMGNPTSGIPTPQPTGPMPPVQQTGADQQPMPAPPMPPMPPQSGGIGSDAARVPNQPPIPAPAPPGVTAPSQIAVPPVPIVPPGGGADAAGATKSYQAAGGTMEPPATAPGNGPQARGILGRALGMDPNSERRLSGGLAAGLKAAGNSSGKSPFQALASGAGATLEGGDQADDKTTDKQSKYLDQAIKAAQTGDTRALNQARTQLALAQTQMTLQGKMGKDSVVNSEQQLYLRAQGATNQDANLKILKSQYDKIAMERGSSSPEAKAAMDAYQKTYDDTLNGHLGRLGLDPKKAAEISQKPGMTEKTAIPAKKMTSQEAFDKLPPGSFFVNPKDGQVLMKPMKGVGAAAAAVGPDGQQPAGAPAPGGQNLPAGQGGMPAPTGTSLPPMPPKLPTSPVATSIPGYGADEGDDEKEAA